MISAIDILSEFRGRKMTIVVGEKDGEANG